MSPESLELEAKVLYTLPAGETAVVGEINRDVAEIAGIQKLPRDEIKDVLDMLKEIGLAECEGDAWRLTGQVAVHSP